MEIVRLARPKEIDMYNHKITFTRDFLLCSVVPMEEKLYIFPTVLENRTDIEPSSDAFLSFFEFHGRDGYNVSEVLIPEDFYMIGFARSILYHSYKKHGGGDGRSNWFKHSFEHGTKIHRSKMIPDFLMITGQNLRVSSRGIEN